MYHLPKSIVKHIYEFDPTFHGIYNIVLSEFKFKTQFWRLKWLNRNLDHINIYTQNIYKIGDFQSSHKCIIDLCNYWNNTFYEKEQEVLEHIDFTMPYSDSLRKKLIETAKLFGLKIHKKGVYGVTQGP